MPNRVLRDYTDSESVNKLSFEAEVFFIRLMMKVDDFGKYHANEKLLKAALFPFKDEISENMIIGYLTECRSADLIDWYSVNNKKYLKIKNFGQRLRRMISKFPDPLTIDSNPPSSDSSSPPETETETKQNPETESETKRQSFFEKSIKDGVWHETLIRTCKINNPAHWINEFNHHATATQEHYNVIADWRRHCTNWIKSELRKRPDQPKPSRTRRDATHG
jgi:hypothetical protein